MPWWGVASSTLAPVLLIGGWTAAADLQPLPFDPVSRSISALATEGMPYRWLITIALLGVGTCEIITGFGLQQAEDKGRILLILGGVSGVLIAANPQLQHGGSPVHEIFSFVGVIVMTIWPLAAIRREPGAPYALRPRFAWSYAIFTVALLLWFTSQLFHGPMLGLAERVVTADQTLWPLIVVLSVLTVRRRARIPAGMEMADVSAQ
jgi:hypothetical membrane protein